MGAGSPETASATAVAALLVLAALVGVAAAGDIVHQDDDAPKIPGCSNDFMLVRAVHPSSSFLSS
jgi:signal peptide peptidase-like protein 2B